MYSLLWKLARPALRKHKRLRENFAQRLVPPDWPYSPAMQAPGYQAAWLAGCAQMSAQISGQTFGQAGEAGLSGPAASACPPPQSCQPRQIWLQAASGGEAYLAWELIKLMAAQPGGPQRLPLLATTCTRQGLDILQQAQLDPACAGVDLAVNYLPLDEKPLMRRALAQAFGFNLPPAAAQVGGNQQIQPVAPTAPISNGSPASHDSHTPTGPRPVLALLETEIWPGLLAACRAAGVGTAIINARMSQGSFKAYRLLSPWLRRYAPQAVLATADDDLKRFCRVFDSNPAKPLLPALNAPVRALMPNMKFDRLAANLPVNEPGKLPGNVQPDMPPDISAATSPAAAPKAQPTTQTIARPIAQPTTRTIVQPIARPASIILLASVRQEEEAALAPILPALLAQAPQSCLALAPRHLHRVPAWREHLQKLGLPHCLRSAFPSPQAVSFAPGQLVLWDSFGELNALYNMAGAVFVGGSLAPLGGQNFLEPLACGLVPCLGPHWSNFYWAGEELFSQGLARRVPNAAALPQTLLELAQHPRPRHEVQSAFAAYLAPRRGGSAQAAALLLALRAPLSAPSPVGHPVGSPVGSSGHPDHPGEAAHGL